MQRYFNYEVQVTLIMSESDTAKSLSDLRTLEI